MFETMEQIRDANERARERFFDPATMRRTGRRIGGTVFGGRFFTVSEHRHGKRRDRGWASPRLWEVMVCHQGGFVLHVGPCYQSLRTARRAAENAAATFAVTGACPCVLCRGLWHRTPE